MADTLVNVTGKKKCREPHSPFLMRTANKSNTNRVAPQVANQILMDQKMARQPPSTQMPLKCIAYDGYERHNGSLLLVAYARRGIVF